MEQYKVQKIKKELRQSLLLLPAIIMMSIFFIVPIILTVYYSFTNLALTGSNVKNFQFIGFENYITMFTDPRMWDSVRITLLFLIGGLIGQTAIGFIIAYLMKNKATWFRSIVGPCILAGWVMPEIVVALSCFAFFDNSGTFNTLLGVFGLDGISWLYKYPLLTVILANIWHGTAFSMLNFQSALGNVPKSIEEAARVDGASRFTTLFRIIIPCIKDTIATNTMLNTLSTLGVFGLVWAMTGGGPGTATTILPVYMYTAGLKNFQLGQGTAIGMVLLFVGALCSILYASIIRNEK